MSVAPDVETAKEHCQPEDITPVRLDAAGLESTAPEYLRDLKHELAGEGLYPAGLSVSARFDEAGSLATQDEADRLREYVRAAAFLGVSALTVEVLEVADEDAVRPALSACVERARREGVTVTIEGPVSLE